jgi:hypothetical protein
MCYSLLCRCTLMAGRVTSVALSFFLSFFVGHGRENTDERFLLGRIPNCGTARTLVTKEDT